VTPVETVIGVGRKTMNFQTLTAIQILLRSAHNFVVDAVETARKANGHDVAERLNPLAREIKYELDHLERLRDEARK
jgi:hypothetical protein